MCGVREIGVVDLDLSWPGGVADTEGGRGLLGWWLWWLWWWWLLTEVGVEVMGDGLGGSGDPGVGRRMGMAAAVGMFFCPDDDCNPDGGRAGGSVDGSVDGSSDDDVDDGAVVVMVVVVMAVGVAVVMKGVAAVVAMAAATAALLAPEERSGG